MNKYRPNGKYSYSTVNYDLFRAFDDGNIKHCSNVSDRTREKMSMAMMGKGKGISKSNESKKKNSEWHINHPNRKFKDTSIELKVEEELKRRGINYQKQIPLCNIAVVDFYLPEYRIVIQADGDYWHNLLGAKERDEKQDRVLMFNGFNVYRFWEHEINESIEKCIDKLNI